MVELCAAGRGKPDDVRAWLASLAELIPVPDRFARYTMSRDATLNFLKIGEHTLDTLAGDGLRFRDSDGDRFFEQHDVWTLGFHSGTNRSVSELASKSVVRFCRGAAGEWVRPMSWRVRTFAACPEREKCDGTWTHAPIRPDLVHGRVLETTVGPGARAPEPSGQVGGKPATVVLDCVTESRGEKLPLRSPLARRLYRETLGELRSGEIRFQALPGALAAQPDLARSHRITNCMSTATYLAKTLTEGGLTARSRNGYLAGVGAMPHGWTEIYEDGVWKILDPTVAFVARRWHLKDAQADQFDEFCAGSPYNRLIPFDCEAGAALVSHTHDAVAFPEVPTEVDARAASAR
ncbi:hypothetical protein [Amycolatopsis silviterrae]|uniref:Transglutaminase-like domain-containing protein n=1 Tax=Amycolatopsis silviterrae TaxID=1656914 RepID=A0ABW5H2E7_9PSEU